MKTVQLLYLLQTWQSFTRTSQSTLTIEIRIVPCLRGYDNNKTSRQIHSELKFYSAACRRRHSSFIVISHFTPNMTDRFDVRGPAVYKMFLAIMIDGRFFSSTCVTILAIVRRLRFAFKNATLLHPLPAYTRESTLRKFRSPRHSHLLIDYRFMKY